ncbi:hypothetical protein ACYOEI_09945 [Singulisphaera rosea]
MAIDKRPPRLDAGHTIPSPRGRRPDEASTYGVLQPAAPIDFDRLGRDLSAQGRFIDDPERILAELDEGIAQCSTSADGDPFEPTRYIRAE